MALRQHPNQKNRGPKIIDAPYDYGALVSHDAARVLLKGETPLQTASHERFRCR